MKEGRTLRRFIIVMSALGLSLVLIWCAFYFITISNVRKNAGVQADAQSEAIISRLEDEIKSVEEISYTLAYNSKVIDLASITNPLDFYDYGARVVESVETVIGSDDSVSDIVVMEKSGLHYRLKGKCPNTILRRIQNMAKEPLNYFFVTGNGLTYIGTARNIVAEGVDLGYVVLLLDKTKVDYIFSDYSEIDYMGIVLWAGDQVLTSNRDIQVEDIDEIKEKSVIYKEQTIDITGLTLLVYCENTISRELKGYFRVALPVMILVLAATIIFFTLYWNRTSLGPQERQLLENKMEIQAAQLENERTLTSLLKKQISAHFTVNALTSVRSLINKGEKKEAAHMCDELSWLLRYSNAPEELISLMQEIYVLEQYVGIMKVRYPDRIEFNTEMEDYYEDIFIPRMILQPIIENAIVYGLRGHDKINISLKTEKDDDLVIIISDDGAGIDPGQLSEIRESIENADKIDKEGIKGVALINIQKRIHIACGPGYGISVESEKGRGTCVRVKLKI